MFYVLSNEKNAFHGFFRSLLPEIGLRGSKMHKKIGEQKGKNLWPAAIDLLGIPLLLISCLWKIYRYLILPNIYCGILSLEIIYHFDNLT